ncbi:MAG: hypothetical protein EB141_07225 [Verrucomicrobia bacterium]|nr:hypothetical protein [Verrucomicrobiota bacterium]NBU09041.1 hypothetical protein [Pseudomonadota bacterium]NDA65844.1 hypothetical protein [Verrucomicrobiota bacterium]NDB75421.1 hypothetical protein [Verrucomicrobiota bacterium]NDD37591.1 hypothetical protein [Verrucomicrobiota bacterium]
MCSMTAGSARQLRITAPRANRAVLWVSLLLGLAAAVSAAERFDDIAVAPQVFFQGQTYHGYVEMRFSVENQSPDRTRKVTLATPHQVHGNWGNNLRRVGRTVTVSPGATVSVTLWQPPLLLNGDNQVEVFVDGRYRGAIPRGGNNQHMQRNASIPGGPRAVLVSRSLNSDDLDKAFRGGVVASPPAGPYSAEQATGAPNVPRGSSGMQPFAWAPEGSRSGPEWLEVDFKPLRTGAKFLRIHKLGYDQAFKTVVLKGADGVDLATVVVTNSANRTFSVSLLQIPLPALTNAIQTVRLNMDASSAGGRVSVDAVELSDGSTSTYATDARASSTWATRMRSGPSASAYQGPTVLRSELEAGNWSESWLAFTPFDLIVISRTDFAAMSPTTQSALWSYVEVGGAVAVLGLAELPKEWRSSVSGNHPLGDDHHFLAGFGQCLLLNAVNVSALSRAQVELLRTATSKTGQPWSAMPTEGNANNEFPVIDNVQIPVRGIVFIMLAFILIVGPLNIFLCARANRRTAMLWTIPVISLVTCAIVFGYSLLSEGITPSSRTEAITVLDQAAHRATTLARQAFYTPLTPGDGLRYSHETEVTPLVELSGYKGGSARELELSQAQHLTRGWVTARVPAHFALRKSETRRERITMQKLPDGRVTVVNGLGADIQKLWMRDEQGQIFTGGALRAGQNVPLLLDSTSAQATSAIMPSSLYQGSWPAAHDTLVGTPINYLRRGTYLAVLAETPFIENGLGNPGKTRARQTIIGLLGPEDVK